MVKLDAFIKTLAEMRNFLLSYASKAKITADSQVHLVVIEQLVVQGTSETQPIAVISWRRIGCH